MSRFGFGLGGVSWGAGRRHGRGDPRVTVVLLVLFVLAVLVDHTFAQVDVAVLQRNALLAAGGLAVLVAAAVYFQRRRAAREEEEASLRTNPTADVVALRFAFDASAAPRIVREVMAAARKPVAERLRAVVQRLIDAQLDYRRVGLETTKPLPETAAAELFFSWADGARARYPRPTAPTHEGLVVLCLHVETTEEIPDFATDDPNSVLATLETLRDQQRTVRRVDVWASRHPLPEATLAELDPKLLPARA